jgi:hypothetical protein
MVTVRGGMTLPERVATSTTRHLELVDAALPGLISRLFVVGSVALGDYHEGTSDIDFIATTSRSIEPRDHALLRAVHEQLGATGDPAYDGFYIEDSRVTRTPPMAHEPTAYVEDGKYFVDEPCFQLSPVTWVEFRQSSISIRGTRPAVAAPDEERLRRWLVGNLKSYWSGEADRLVRLLRGQPQDAPIDSGEVVWAVLGPPRLHYTLATGAVTSKSGAALYAAEAFPGWASLVRACQQARASSDGTFNVGDGGDCVRLIRTVVDDAVARWG